MLRPLAVASSAVLLVLVAASARSETPPTSGPDVAEAIRRYAQDPVKNRKALRAFRGMDPGQAGPAMSLVLADSDLRSGRRASAARRFEAVLALQPGLPWTTWAHMGLGWIALQNDDPTTARGHYTTAAADASPSRNLAVYMLGVMDADAGDWRSADDRLRSVADSSFAGPSLRSAAVLARAYVAYWAGDLQDAADAFARAPSAMPDARFHDDARYGEAMARWRLGQRAIALATFRTLASETGRGRRPPMTPGLVMLEYGALLKTGFQEYRRAPLTSPDDQATSMFDLDATAMARAALRSVGDAEGNPSNVDEAPAVIEKAAATFPAAATGKPTSTAPLPERGSQLISYALLVLAALVLVVFAVQRRAAPDKRR